MMRLQAAKARAATANEAALLAEKAKDAAEEEVERLQDVLEPKRQRVEAAATDEDGPAHGMGEWDLADHRREMTRALNRREIEIGSKESAMPVPNYWIGYCTCARGSV
jgi:hypothetical protein